MRKKLKANIYIWLNANTKRIVYHRA